MIWISDTKRSVFRDSGLLNLYSWFQDQVLSGFRFHDVNFGSKGTAEIKDSTSIDSGFQKVLFFPGFRISRPVFLIPRPNIFWIPHSMMWTSDPRYCWDSRFHLSRFRLPKVPFSRISRTGFQIPRPIFSGFQIPRATVFWIPDSGLYFILHGTKFLVWASNLDSPAGTHGFLDPQEPSSH